MNWPMVAVHATLMPNGSILHDRRSGIGATTRRYTTRQRIALTPVTVADNLFCSGQITLADGRVLVNGGHINGHIGLNTAYIFNPQSQTWTKSGSMAYGRWYPTLTALPDGKVITTSGEIDCDGCYAATHEIYNPTTGTWSKLTGADFSFSYYPHSFVLPDGRLLVSSTAETPTISRVSGFQHQDMDSDRFDRPRWRYSRHVSRRQDPEGRYLSESGLGGSIVCRDRLRAGYESAFSGMATGRVDGLPANLRYFYFAA